MYAMFHHACQRRLCKRSSIPITKPLCVLGVAAMLMIAVIVLVAHSSCNVATGGKKCWAGRAYPSMQELVVMPNTTQKGEVAAVLHDKDDNCAEWAASDECTENPAYMMDMCSLSCKEHHQKWRLLVIRTNRVASTAFGGWILRAVQASRGRLEAYRADDGEVARSGVTAWAAHANAVLRNRTMGPFPEWVDRATLPTDRDTDVIHGGGGHATLIVVWIRSPASQFASAFGSFKSSRMGQYGVSVSDTLRHPPQPENWRLDNMNARSLGWGPLVSGAWDKKLTPSQERHDAGPTPQAFVAQVEREVDLVLIADHLVESLVLLRRALGFSASTLYSDLAMMKGINAHLSEVSGLDTSMGPDDMQRLCSDIWSSVDCALFEHFNASLWTKVGSGGKEFAEEVGNVRRHWNTLDKCCEDNSCALAEHIETCDRIRESARVARSAPIIVQF